MALKDKDLLVLQTAVAGFAVSNALVAVLRDKGALTQTDEIAVMEHALRQIDLLARAVPHPVLSAARLQYAGQLDQKRKAYAMN